MSSPSEWRPRPGRTPYLFEPDATRAGQLYLRPPATPLPVTPDEIPALRRVFQGTPFQPGSGSAALLDFLLAPTLSQARETARGLEGRLDSIAQDALWDALRAASLDPAAIRTPWGQEPVLDHLRARRLASRSARPAPTWEGALRWLGERLDAIPTLAGLPPSAVPAVAAALQARHGARAAFDTLAQVIHRTDQHAWRAQRTLASLALRSILDGHFTPAHAVWLLPNTAQRRPWQPADPRPPLHALLALQALREQRHAAGQTHLTAALAASARRRAFVRSVQTTANAAFHWPAWGTAAPLASGDPAHERRWADARAYLKVLPRPVARPFPEGWGAPQPALYEAALARWLSAPSVQADAAQLDDGLALVAAWALTGHPASAQAQMLSLRMPGHPAALKAWQVVTQAVCRGPAAAHAATVGAPLTDAFGPAAQQLLQAVRAYPDPGPALGTPWWALTPGEIFTRLVKLGQTALATRVRTALRPDLLPRLQPFWLLNPRHAPSLRAAVGFTHRHGPALAPREAVLFLERTCRSLIG